MVTRDLNCFTEEEVRGARKYRFGIERALPEGCNDVARQNDIKAGRASAEAAGRQSSRARQVSATPVAAPARLQTHAATFLLECAGAFPGQDRSAGRGSVPLQRGRYNQEIGLVHPNRAARSRLATTGRTSRSRPEKCRILAIPAWCCLVDTPPHYYRTLSPLSSARSP
jgi:hypothetical protein